MKSFAQVYNISKNTVLNEQKESILQQRSQLIAAMKKEFGITSFNECNEAEKKSYKSMINEMWNANTGLTKSGYKFINESAVPLTKDSTEKQVEEFFKKKVKANVRKCIAALVAGERCELISDLRSHIEEKTGKKLSDNKCKKWVSDICTKCVCESVNAMSIDNPDAFANAIKFSTGKRINVSEEYYQYKVTDLGLDDPTYAQIFTYAIGSVANENRCDRNTAMRDYGKEIQDRVALELEQLSADKLNQWAKNFIQSVKDGSATKRLRHKVYTNDAPFNPESEHSWYNMISDGAVEGKITLSDNEQDIPFYDIFEYAKAEGIKFQFGVQVPENVRLAIIKAVKKVKEHIKAGLLYSENISFKH